MRFAISIKDTNNIFYKVCKQHGQAMGMAVPFVLAQENVFSVVFSEDGKVILEDKRQKKYKTHYNEKGDKYNVAPSWQKGFGRKFDLSCAKAHIMEVDYHIFSKLLGDSLQCIILSSKEVAEQMDVTNGEFRVFG